MRKHHLWGILVLLPVLTQASFAQVVEIPFENSAQTADIVVEDMGKLVETDPFYVNPAEYEQNPPDFSEFLATGNYFYNLLPDKFSTGVEESLGTILLNRAPLLVYESPKTERAFSATWSIDPENGTAEMLSSTGKPGLFDIHLNSRSLRIDYFHSFCEIPPEDELSALLEPCISYSYVSYTQDPADVRETLNTLVDAEVIRADGTVQELTVQILAYSEGNNRYSHEYYFEETLTDDVVEFRFSLHLPESEPVVTQIEPTKVQFTFGR